MPCTSCNSTKVSCKSRKKRVKENQSKLNTLITLVEDNQDYKEVLKDIEELISKFGFCIDYQILNEITNYVESEYNKHS